MDIKTMIKYILLGAIQGFTEPLPISSSAHMIIASYYLNISIDLDFEIIIHFASFLAILIFFLPELLPFVKTIKNNETKKEIFTLIIASIPIAIIGFLFKDYIEHNFNSIRSVGYFLLITSVLLLISGLLLNYATKEKISTKNSLIIGLIQAVALIPGISRSGATICGGIVQKVNIKRILTFSFFLYLIASFGALILALGDFSLINHQILYLVITFIASFIGTSIAIRWLFNIISKQSLYLFSLYTFLLGLSQIINLF